jgi:RNA polymerase sigma-70 factor (ECF subfamily)
VSRASHLSLVTGVSAHEIDDAELARRLMARDPSVATEAWDRFAPMVQGLLRRALGPTSETEDLTQEVFVRLCAKIATLQSHAALRSFVYSIAVRVLREELRRRKVKRWLRLSKTGELPESQASPSNPEGREALAHFHAILDELGEKERTVFFLRHVEGLPLGDIGQACDASLATVKRRLARASDRVDLLMKRDPTLASYLSKRGGDDP